MRALIRCRNRRFTRLRITAPPTALETTNPARGGGKASAGAGAAGKSVGAVSGGRTSAGAGTGAGAGVTAGAAVSGTGGAAVARP